MNTLAFSLFAELTFFNMFGSSVIPTVGCQSVKNTIILMGFLTCDNCVIASINASFIFVPPVESRFLIYFNADCISPFQAET
ncbi:MAG: hypothetical protein AAB116_07155, partial [Candidatus Poribacteria bacterium]